MWNDNSKKPIWIFLILTFSISWVCEAILIVVEQTGILASGAAGFVIVMFYRGITVACAPAYATFILLKKRGQISGIKDFFLCIFKTESILKTVIITAAFFLFQLIIDLFSGEYLGDMWYSAWIVAPMLAIGIIGGGMEEPGWRGFLQPALEEKLPFAVATLCVGVIWAVWHIPTWFVQSVSQSSLNFLSFAFECVVLSFVMATLYKLTKSIFACVLFHSWTNALGSIISKSYLADLPDAKFIAISSVQIIAAIVICFYVDKKKNDSQKINNININP